MPRANSQTPCHCHWLVVNKLIIASHILTVLWRKHRHCNIALVSGGKYFALKIRAPTIRCSLVNLMAIRLCLLNSITVSSDCHLSVLQTPPPRLSCVFSFNNYCNSLLQSCTNYINTLETQCSLFLFTFLKLLAAFFVMHTFILPN